MDLDVASDERTARHIVDSLDLEHVRTAGRQRPRLSAVVDVDGEADLLRACHLRLIGLALELRSQVAVSDIAALRIHGYRAAVSSAATEPEKWNPQTRETADHSIPYLVLRFRISVLVLGLDWRLQWEAR